MSKRQKIPARLSEQLMQALLECGETRYRVSKNTGIDEATLSRFVNGKQALSLEKVDILGHYLGLRLVALKKGKGK